MNIINNKLDIIEKPPSYATISLWMYKIGFYLLERVEFEKRNDRILILDFQAPASPFKTLTVLTTTLEKVITNSD
ncbi:MAG: hypothetical protein HQK49_10725 [Oligoflexia bacterium]|nr:hypothetical protein [Oligoflexia bacterium]